MELVQNFSTNYLSVYYGIVQIFSFKPQTMVIIRWMIYFFHIKQVKLL